ncbi:MAG: phytanoyl-CoA dioxygenase family protein [Anaerolineae bacterium]|nr:phytanoyl-CoA dioxygenase family protein [Anaerolineae bacterium]
MHDIDALVTDQDVAFYQEHGYWIGPKVLADDELAILRAHHQRVADGEYETGRPPHSRSIPPGEPVNTILKIDNAHWSDAHLARLALNRTIGAIAARLAGARGMRLWHDQLLLKPPKSGSGNGAVGWHQDWYYWQCATPAEMLTAWVALVDVDEENGCMEVVPGSHKWGLLPEGDFFEQDLDTLKARIERVSGKPFETQPCVLPAGAFSIHHCLTVHGSRPNVSADRVRRSLVLHLLPEGTRYRAGTPAEAHANVRLLSGQDGDPFAGPYFPVLYRAGDTANSWDVPA